MIYIAAQMFVCAAYHEQYPHICGQEDKYGRL